LIEFGAKATERRDDMATETFRTDDLERVRGNRVLADETVVFGLDSRSYVIDLSSENAEELRKVLGDYLEAARPLAEERRGHPLSAAQAKRAELQAVRDWAEAQGTTVKPRGRIPRDVVRNYERANGPLKHQDP
jgi:hypothetical protein